MGGRGSTSKLVRARNPYSRSTAATTAESTYTAAAESYRAAGSRR